MSIAAGGSGFTQPGLINADLLDCTLPIWDGIKFSQCFWQKTILGYLSIAFVSVSIAILLVYALSARRVKANSKTVVQEVGTIKQEENGVIIGMAEDQSLDLTQKDMEQLSGRVGFVPASSKRDLIPLATQSPSASVSLLTRIAQTKKDIIGVFGSVLILASSIQHLNHNSPLLIWQCAYISSWAWFSLLLTVKAVVSFVTWSKSEAYPPKSSSLYETLEIIIIPWFAFSSIVEFFEFRAALIEYGSIPEQGRIGYIIDALSYTWPRAFLFTLMASILLMELMSKRPSRFAPMYASKDELRAPLDQGVSILNHITFGYLNKFLFDAAEASFRHKKDIRLLDDEEEIQLEKDLEKMVTMKTIPQLRADDLTSRVMLAYRGDTSCFDYPFESRTSLYRKITGTFSFKLAYHFRELLLLQQFYVLLRVSTVIFPPLFLKWIIGYISSGGNDIIGTAEVAILFSVGMFACQVLQSLASQQGLYIGRRICVRLRSIVISEIFTKALRRKDEVKILSQADNEVNIEEAKKKPEAISNGKIINLISIDTFRVSEVSAYVHFVTEMSSTIIISSILLFKILGPSAVPGLGTLMILIPTGWAIAKTFLKYQELMLNAADKRLQLVTEVIQNVRIVKYFAWEDKFIQMMSSTRAVELEALWKRCLTVLCSNVVSIGTPTIVSLVTFLFHTKVFHTPLDAETAFTALSLFTIIRGPLESFTDIIVSVLQAQVSLTRVDEFLHEAETEKYDLLTSTRAESDPLIGFKNASFAWDDASEGSFMLKDLNISFPEGELSLILGPVGSGKSTLLLSLLGETTKIKGEVFLPSPIVRLSPENPDILTESTAYCSQNPWLQSATIEENILFGAPMNRARYNKVLHACALEPDLKQFEGGDQTEVGEKGTVLSGGQKARISLARAVYSSAKYVLLDDVLSAVDTHTGQHLYTHCLLGSIMKHRTCILVTHAVDLCLPGASYVVTLENGSMSSGGSPSRIPSRLLLEAQPDAAMASAINILSEIERGEIEKKEKFKLIQDESQAEGAVTREVYFMYFCALGGLPFGIACFLIYFMTLANETAVSAALRYWVQAQVDNNPDMIFQTLYRYPHDLALGLIHPVQAWSDNTSAISDFTGRSIDEVFWFKSYIFLSCLVLVLYVIRTYYFLSGALEASRLIYERLISSILGAPTRFFDSTPTGRIINRLSKDVETLDQDNALTLLFFLMEIFSVCGIIGVIIFVLPQFLLPAVFILFTYFLIAMLYLQASRELKRFDSVTRSPLFSLFGESLNGIVTVRAYGDSSRFIKQIFNYLDTNNRPFWILWMANRWLSVRIDITGAFVTLVTCIIVILSPRDFMDASLAGFTLTFAMSLTDRTLWLVRLFANVEMNFNSVERINEYMTLPQEKKDGLIPAAVWPSRDGSIVVDSLTASYAPELPPALKKVSFTVNPQEKIGICGRTGSGKSTLGLSFFRFIEPSAGRIIIDGVDINTLSLTELRSRITIVAQETALFAGTLRFNLDPFGIVSDEEMWDALRRVHLVQASAPPSQLPSRAPSLSELSPDVEESVEEHVLIQSLDMVVAEGGKNFSVGQRQLLSIARGILKLKNSSILILDESTASLDHDMDGKLQKTIREQMHNATVLCIAHRLRTIIDYDRILVLGGGEVIEYDTPVNLLEKKGVFYDLCQNSGEYEELVNMAYRQT